MSIEQILYKAHASATGGREGHIFSPSGSLDMKLTTPKELGGAGAAGANPEELFAAGYAACFIGAMKFVCAQKKTTLHADTKVDAVVGIGKIPSGFNVEVDLKINVPGMAKADAEALVHAAHEVCPYSNATRGNIDVRLSVV